MLFYGRHHRNGRRQCRSSRNSAVVRRIELDAMVRAGSAIKPVLEDSIFWAIAWIAIAIIGIAYQVRAHRDTTFTVETCHQGWG